MNAELTIITKGGRKEKVQMNYYISDSLLQLQKQTEFPVSKQMMHAKLVTKINVHTLPKKCILM